MSIQVTRRWDPTPGSGLPRRDRTGCEYRAFIPDRLTERTFLLEGGVAADVADAEAAILRLNLEASALVDSEAVARLLLRAEAVASSKIEGLEAGGRRLLRAQAARDLGDEVRDVTAEEILANVAAMCLGDPGCRRSRDDQARPHHGGSSAPSRQHPSSRPGRRRS